MYLSARLSFCPYALYRELIAIDRAFSLRLLCFVKQTHFKLIDASLFIPEVGFYTVLDCCLELGAIPVSCSKRGCASRPVCDDTCIKCASLRAHSFYFNLLGMI